MFLGKFLVMPFTTFGASLLGNMFEVKRLARDDNGIIRPSEGTNRAGQDF